jgi:hypothetical protein
MAQDNDRQMAYEAMMGSPQDPEDHPANNLPEASDPRWGEQLGQEPQAPREVKDNKREERGESEKRQRAEGEKSGKSGTTKTKGKR